MAGGKTERVLDMTASIFGQGSPVRVLRRLVRVVRFGWRALQPFPMVKAHGQASTKSGRRDSPRPIDVMGAPSSDTSQHMTALTHEDRAHLVDVIQETTRGFTDDQRLKIANNWEWMAQELRRVVAVNGGAL